MHLIETPYNPAPPDPKSGLLEVEVGIFLRYAYWRLQPSGSKGTIILLQGRGEFIEKNFETVNDLLEKGFDVLCFDWRGQGGSSRLIKNRNAGYIDSFEEYVTDLKAVINQVGLPDCRAPLFVLSHSTGSLVALLSAPQIANKIDRMVLCAPLIGLNTRRFPERHVKWLAGAFAALGMGEVLFNRSTRYDENSRFGYDALTSCPERFDRTQRFARDHPELCIGGATASWIFAACRAMEEVRHPDFHDTVNIPLLVVNAGMDRVVNNIVSERLIHKMRVGSTLTIDGARHEIWHERDVYREQMLAAVGAFLPGSGIK